MQTQTLGLEDKVALVRTFRTVKPLHDGAGAVRSRGTRVWKVKEVINGAEELESSEYVLKDSWIDFEVGRGQPEGFIYAALSRFIDEHPEWEEISTELPHCPGAWISPCL